MIIFDIDGVLADNSHRLHYAKEGNFVKYYSQEEVLKDEPLLKGVNLLSMFKGHEIHFVTGRSEICREATIKWLKRILMLAHMGALPFPVEVSMRNTGDHRPSPIVKVELMGELLTHLEKLPVLSTMEPPSGYFIDDDPNNIIAIEKAFPNFKGLCFGTERLYEVAEVKPNE
ncbi:hypothetical protein IKD67_01870 [Candidatus Saccharibacteria bacterium]|nr:hypothetical protein [Candidatus Saccharibacteria bacterium]